MYSVETAKYPQFFLAQLAELIMKADQINAVCVYVHGCASVCMLTRMAQITTPIHRDL